MRHSKLTAVLLTALGSALLAGESSAAASVERALNPIPGKFIVVLREGVAVADANGPSGRSSVSQVANQMARLHAGTAGRKFGTALSGFVFEGTSGAAEALAHDSRVAYVAEDGLVSVAGMQSPTPSWGLDRIDQRLLPLDQAYSYYNDGTGVDIYIMDTGIRSTHEDFGNRVDTADYYSTVADTLGGEDCYGHGTLVAGIAAGEKYGVAKGATLHSVRVLDCYGQGAISHMIAAIDWITAHYPKGTSKRPAPPTRAVVNISVDAGFSQALDDAVANSIGFGITYVVAAGNGAGDACNSSPARAIGAITVGAIDSMESRATYSNQGSCVDLFAPGTQVVSTFIRSDSDVSPFTGTSAAAPHVAGTAAMMLAANPNAKPKDVEATLKAAATPDVLANVSIDTPNLLLFSAFAGSGEDFPPFATFKLTCSAKDCSFDATAAADDWGIASFSWAFGDGRSGSGVKASHRYRTASSAGIVVRLTVTDTDGQSATFERSLAGAW